MKKDRFESLDASDQASVSQAIQDLLRSWRLQDQVYGHVGHVQRFPALNVIKVKGKQLPIRIVFGIDPAIILSITALLSYVYMGYCFKRLYKISVCPTN